jgi:CrcB protein
MAEASTGIGAAAQWAAVFVAGGLGAALRVAMASWLEPVLVARLPHAGVLLVNLLGCLAIGFAAIALTQAHWRVIVLGGLLGGFTTYSTFALFSVELGQAGRVGVLLAQCGLHLLGGIACVLLGSALARALGLATS